LRFGEFLIEMAEQGAVVCPVPPEANAESLPLPVEKRLELQAKLRLLATNRDGKGLIAFKGLWQLIAEESLALARREPPPPAIELFDWLPMDDDETAKAIVNCYRSAKVQWKGNVARMGLTTGPKRTIEEIRADVVMEHASHVFRQINRALDDQPLSPNDSMAIGLLERLLAMGITKNELLELRAAVVDRTWQQIPVVTYRTILAAQLEAGYSTGIRDYDPNDEFDVSRLAVGLWAADVIITEAFMADTCRKAGTKNYSSAEVFSTRDVADVAEFIRARLSAQGRFDLR
jgi:hypothetical protein